MALKAYNSLFVNTKELSTTQERLSSGKRINSAADDPSGFILARKLTVRADGLASASENIGNARNVLGVAEGGANSVSKLLEEIRTNVAKAADDSLSDDERIEIQSVVEELADEIDQIVELTRWGNQKLLDGTFQSKFFQTGPDYTDRTNFNIMDSFYASDVGIGQLGWETSSSGSVSNLTVDDGTFITGVSVNSDAKAIAANGYYRIRTLESVGTSASDAKIVIDFDSNGYDVAGGTTWSKTIALNDLYLNSKKTNNKNGLTDNTVLIEGLSISLGAADETDPNNPVFTGLTANATTTFQVEGAQSTKMDLSHHGNAIETLRILDQAITKVNHMTANIGAKSQRLSYKEDFIASAETNVRSAASRIEDADMAKEQLNSSTLQILQQSGLTMMAQSMYLPQNILSLFK